MAKVVPNKRDTDFKMQAVFKFVREVLLFKEPGLKYAACCHYRSGFHTDIIRRTEQPHTHFVAFNYFDDL
jgi:hypothetical protein